MPSNKKLLQAAAGSAGDDPLYVEDVFSTYLYDGVLSGQMYIQNGIDLSGEGGLIWIKSRGAVYDNFLFSTNLTSANSYLRSNTTGIEDSASLSASYESDGFKLNSNNGMSYGGAGYGTPYSSWSFRKAEKFFDIQTYTGNGGTPQNISHSLGSVPGMILVKRTDSAFKWFVYHISTGATNYLQLNDTAAAVNYGGYWNSTAPTDSVFTIGTDTNGNASGGTYVAYLFASDAGGFGDDGTENIIKCGSYTGTGTAGLAVAVGFEPQFVMFKAAVGTTSNWTMLDSMRGIITGGEDRQLYANSSGGEGGGIGIELTANGFNVMDTSGAYNTNGATYIYIAIRRPMKTPEAGTEVFNVTTSATSAAQAAPTPVQYYSGFPVDLLLLGSDIVTNAGARYAHDRLTQGRMQTSATTAENYVADMFDANEGYRPVTLSPNTNYYAYLFRRATGFMDVVAYNGSGSATTQAHNLGVVPELAIVKRRDSSGDWMVTTDFTNRGYFNDAAGFSTDPSFWNSGTSTSTTFPLGTNASINASGGTYVTYLFATVAGVSKVGSYTGTGADLNVDCGFTGGARFILIKRTDSTGDWYTYDSLRGITAGNDPYLLLNVNAIQVTGTDYIDPLNAGFTVTSSAPAALNNNGGTYIFLAIA